MLKTNSKAAKENIRRYIVENFDGTNYSPLYDGIENNFEAIKNAIKVVFNNDYYSHDLRKNRVSGFESFRSWCQGLPSIIDTCYYYNRSAVADLANILEETEAEANRFTETEAEDKLTYLIYREIFA